MATAQTAPAEQHVVLYSVDWRTYERLGRILRGRPGLRLTYDRGSLEIMTLSPRHERLAHLLARLLEALSEELCIVIACFGRMTFKRRVKKRGLEPDECYWIANEPQIRGRDDIDIRKDPPPDLVLEVDIASASVKRMPIYAALRVPEVWQLKNEILSFLVLNAQGKYAASPTSLSFPMITPDDLMRFLALRGQTDENDIIRQFRAWVRQNLGGKP